MFLDEKREFYQCVMRHIRAYEALPKDAPEKIFARAIVREAMETVKRTAKREELRLNRGSITITLNKRKGKPAYPSDKQLKRHESKLRKLSPGDRFIINGGVWVVTRINYKFDDWPGDGWEASFGYIGPVK